MSSYFDLKKYKRICNDIYKSLPEHIISSADFNYCQEVENKADEIYAKIDGERKRRALCRLDKLFAGKKIVAADYEYDGRRIDLKNANIFDYDYFISEIFRQSDNLNIIEVFICEEYAKIDLLIYKRSIMKLRIKEISSEQYNSFVSQQFTSPNDMIFFNRKVFDFCFEIYKQNEYITLRRAALSSVA